MYPESVMKYGDDKETNYQQLDDVALIDANVELKEND